MQQTNNQTDPRINQVINQINAMHKVPSYPFPQVNHDDLLAWKQHAHRSIRIFSTTGELTPDCKAFYQFLPDFTNLVCESLQEIEGTELESKLQEIGLEHYQYYYEIQLSNLSAFKTFFEAFLLNYIKDSIEQYNHISDDDYYDNIPDAIDQLFQMTAYLYGDSSFNEDILSCLTDEEYGNRFDELIEEHIQDDSYKAYNEQILKTINL